MAFVKSEKAWGLACTINTATAADNVAVDLKAPVKVGAIICGGAATTDITTIKDGYGDRIWQGCATVGTSNSIVFPQGKTLHGIWVGFAGATTGWCNIVYSET